MQLTDLTTQVRSDEDRVRALHRLDRRAVRIDDFVIEQTEQEEMERIFTHSVIRLTTLHVLDDPIRERFITKRVSVTLDCVVRAHIQLKAGRL